MSKKKKKTGRDAINRVSTNNRVSTDSEFKLPFEAKYLSYALLAILVLLVIFIRLKLDGIPMERDEGIYAYGGRMILDGKVPYLDFYEQKFPGLFYAYAGIMAIFGRTLESIHHGFTFLNVTTILMLFFIGRRLFNDFAGLIIAATFALVSLTPYASGFTRQSEHIIAFFATAAILSTLKALDTNKLLWFTLAGIMACLSLCVKTNGVFYIILLGLSMVIYYILTKPINWKKLLLNVGTYSAAVFFTFALMCLIMAAQGAFSEMWYFAVEFPRTYVSAVPFDAGMGFLKKFGGNVISGYLPFWIAAAGGIFFLFFTKENLHKKIWMPVWAVFAFLTVTPGLRFYGHYWLMLMPVLAILVGATFYTLQSLLSGRGKMLGILVPALLFGAIFIQNIASHSSYYFYPDYKIILRNTYGTNPFPESKVIGDKLKERAQPDDKILLFGSEPQLYIYTGMDAPNRHAYFTHLVSDATKTRANEWQKEYIDNLNKEKPRFIVIFQNQVSLGVKPNANRSVFDFIGNYLNNGYQKIGNVDILGRGNTLYNWDVQQVQTYKPRSSSFIDVFELKR